MPLEQGDLTHQNEVQPQYNFDDIGDISHEPEPSADASNEVDPGMSQYPWESLEMDLDLLNWDDWLNSTDNIKADQNHPEGHGLMTNPLISTFGSLDNRQNPLLANSTTVSNLSNFNYGTNPGYTLEYDGLNYIRVPVTFEHNPYRTSANNPQASDNVISPNVFEPRRTSTTMDLDLEAQQFLENNDEQRSSTTLSGQAETSRNSETFKSSRKSRKDKGVKRGSKRQEYSAEPDDTVQGENKISGVASKRRRGLGDDGETPYIQKDVPQTSARNSGRSLAEVTSDMIDEIEWDNTTRPKWGRKDAHENVKYRYNRRHQDEKTKANGKSRPHSEVSLSGNAHRLFQHLSTTVPPKKASSRNKSGSKQTSAPIASGVSASLTVPHPAESAALLLASPSIAPVASAAATPHAAPGTSQVTQETIPRSSEAEALESEKVPATTRERVRRSQNHRLHISEDVVRQAAPEGWNPYDNEFYSGDDNISDDGVERQGKASSYKPPRMACRRCNRYKQLCDHNYPACSLCEKYGQRCRYRDDLTGRQMRPGHLEAVEEGYHRSQERIRHLEAELEESRASLHRANNEVLNWQNTVRNIMNLNRSRGYSVKSRDKQGSEDTTE